MRWNQSQRLTNCLNLNNSLVVIHEIRIFSEDFVEVVFSYLEEDASKGK